MNVIHWDCQGSSRWMTLQVWLPERKRETNYPPFFKLSQVEQQKGMEDGGVKTSFCIFVVPEDNVSFISASVFLPFLLESWVFFGNVTLTYPPPPPFPPAPPPYPWVTWEECEPSSRPVETWGSEGEALELDRAKAISQAGRWYPRRYRRLH